MRRTKQRYSSLCPPELYLDNTGGTGNLREFVDFNSVARIRSTLIILHTLASCNRTATNLKVCKNDDQDKQNVRIQTRLSGHTAHTPCLAAHGTRENAFGEVGGFLEMGTTRRRQ